MKQNYYACTLDKNGKTTKVKFDTREEARKYIATLLNANGNNYVQVWTE